MQDLPDLQISIDVNRGYLPYGKTSKNVKGLITIKVNEEGEQVSNLKKSKEEPPKKTLMLLDVSGSMSGYKLETAKSAITEFIENSKPNDKFGLFTFSDGVEEIIPYNKIGDNKSDLINKVDQIYTTGLTAMHSALRKLHEELRRIDDRGKAIIVTDGEPTDETEIEPYKSIAKDIRERGFSLSAWGIGEDYNQELIVTLAEFGAGTWRHIKEKEPEMLKTAIENESIETIVFYAPKLILTPASGVKLTDIKRQLPQISNVHYEQKGNSYEINLPELVLDQPIVYAVTVEVTAPNAPEGAQDQVFTFLEAKVTNIKKDQISKGNVIFTNDPKLYGTETNPLVRIENTVTDLIAETMYDPSSLEKAKQTATKIYQNEGGVLSGTAIGKTVVQLTQASDPDDLDDRRSLQDSLSRPIGD